MARMSQEKEALLVSWDDISDATYRAVSSYLIEEGVIDSCRVVREQDCRAGNLEVVRSAVESKKNLMEMTKLLVELVRLSGSLLLNRETSRERFAKLRLLGIRIGDIAIACHLRRCHSTRVGEIKSLAWCMREVVHYTVGTERMGISRYGLVGVWEQSYLMKVFCRMALEKAYVPYLQINNYPDMFRIYMPDSRRRLYEDHFKVLPEELRRLSEEEKTEAQRFMDKRIDDISSIGYMDSVNQAAESYFFDRYIRTSVEQQENKIDSMAEIPQRWVIIYAHSFSDAQLVKGWNGFSGSFDWMRIVLQVCNKYGVRVALKPHPSWHFIGRDDCHETFQVDGDYIDEVIKKVAQLKDFVTLPMSWRPNKIVERLGGRSELLHISHHGTVIPELAYLGEVTACAKASDWGRIDELSNYYESPDELDNLIRAFSEGKKLTRAPRDLVLRFVHAYYFRRCKEFLSDTSFTFEGAFFDAMRDYYAELRGLTNNEIGLILGSQDMIHKVNDKKAELESALLRSIRLSCRK